MDSESFQHSKNQTSAAEARRLRQSPNMELRLYALAVAALLLLAVGPAASVSLDVPLESITPAKMKQLVSQCLNVFAPTFLLHCLRRVACPSLVRSPSVLRMLAPNWLSSFHGVSRVPASSEPVCSSCLNSAQYWVYLSRSDYLRADLCSKLPYLLAGWPFLFLLKHCLRVSLRLFNSQSLFLCTEVANRAERIA